jgi:hypothetical protein
VSHAIDQHKIYHFFINTPLLTSCIRVTRAKPSNADHDYISSFGDVINIECFLGDIIPHIMGVIMGYLVSYLGIYI